MLLILVLSVSLNFYLFSRLFVLAPEVGGIAKLLEVCLEPLFPKVKPGISLPDISNDLVLLNEIQYAVEKYSDFDMTHTNYCFTDVNSFVRLDVEFSGSEYDMSLFRHILKNAIKNRVSLLANSAGGKVCDFHTDVFDYTKRQTDSSFVVSFLFAYNDVGLQNLLTYAYHERNMQKNFDLTDASLNEEMEENGV